MNKTLTACSLLICLVMAPSLARSQTAPGAAPNTLSRTLKAQFDAIKQNIIESAEKVPESEFSFRPTPEVRSFAELFGHVANAHYLFCSEVKGEKNPSTDNYEKWASRPKADLVRVLSDSIVYCDAVYATMTDTAGVEPMQLFGRESLKFGALMANIAHDNEHYGNMVTYMRLKGRVPPSTERTQPPRR